MMNYTVDCQCDECANYIRIEMSMDALRQAVRSEDIFGHRCPHCKTIDAVFYPCRVVFPNGSTEEAERFVVEYKETGAK
jgi:hypothetical protein